MSRFVLGNCIDVMARIPDNAIDFILTDPPYLVGFRDRFGRTIAGDKTDEWLQPACNEMYRVLKKDALMVSFYGWNRVDRFMAAWKNAGFSVVGHLVFTKNYTSKAAYVGYRHECAYILAKGRPRLPQNPLPDVLGWKYSGSRMRSAVESYAKAHNISNEQATQELASTSTRLSGGMYADAHAEWGVKPKILGVGGGVGIRGGFKGSLDATDDDSHSASSGSRATHDARHDIDARATQDFKEASDYFTSRKVSESGSHTDNNADSRVDQLSAALNSAKQSYDQYTTNMTRSHEYAEMASRTESMSGQMSEDLSQQFAQYVMKHAPQDAEAILTNTSSPEIAERRRAMAWSFVQEQVQPGVDNAWRESRGDIGKGMESVPSGGGSQDIIADHQGHQAIIDQRTQDSNIRNDVKHQVDNMVTEYKGNIGDTQNSIHGEENIVDRQYSELKNNHKQEEIQQNNRYNEENKRQKLIPTPSEDALKQMVDDKKERLKGPL